MNEIRVFPGLIIGGEANKVTYTLIHMDGETQEAYAHRCQEMLKLALSFVPKSETNTIDFSDTTKFKQVGPNAYEAITSDQPETE